MGRSVLASGELGQHNGLRWTIIVSTDLSAGDSQAGSDTAPRVGYVGAGRFQATVRQRVIRARVAATDRSHMMQSEAPDQHAPSPPPHRTAHTDTTTDAHAVDPARG